MTHDELLEKIAYTKALWIHPAYVGFEGLKEAADSIKALRAVVELHKPTTNGIACTICDNAIDKLPAVYPCPTIAVIEKELQ